MPDIAPSSAPVSNNVSTPSSVAPAQVAAPIPSGPTAVPLGTPQDRPVNTGLDFFKPPSTRKAPASIPADDTSNNGQTKSDKPAFNIDEFTGDVKAKSLADKKSAPVQTTLPLDDKPVTTVDADAIRKAAEGKQDASKPADNTPPAIEIPKPAQVHNDADDGRDYSQFLPEERPLLKKVGNEAFAHLSKELPRLRKAEQELTKYKEQQVASIYAEPGAFQLTPEYKQLSQRNTYIQFEEQHWRQQLINLKKGEPVLKDLSFNDKGQPVYTDVKVTPENQAGIETQLLENTQAVFAEKAQLSGAMQQIQASHGDRYNRAVQFLGQANQKYFGALLDPKHPRRNDVQNFKQFIPVEFQQHPLAESLSLSYGYILEVVQAYKELEKKMGNTQQLAADRAKAGPTASEVSGGGSASGNGSSAFKKQQLDIKEWQLNQ